MQLRLNHYNFLMIYRATDQELANFSENLMPLIKKQHDFSKTSLQSKKDIFRRNLQLYNNVDQPDDKIRDRLIRTTIWDMIALDYQNNMSVNFVSRNIYDNEETENLNNVAKQDYTEMKIDEYMYFLKRCKYFYGAGIRVMTWWDDSIRQIPTFQVVNTINARPDPNWSAVIEDYDFYGFDCAMTMEELISYGAWNLDKIDPTGSNVDYQLNKSTVQDTRGIANNQWGSAFDSNSIIVHYHFTVYNWVPVQVLTSNDNCVIQWVKPIIPLMDKSSWYNMKFPISLELWSPLDGDPFGESVPDIIWDAQKTRQLFKNLQRIKATNQALWGKTFIDKRILTSNRNELMKNNVGRQFIGADSLNGMPIANSIFSLPEEQVWPDTYALASQLFEEAQYNTAIDNQTRGMQTNKSQTATESKIIQEWSNIKQLLNSKLTAIGEKQFWTLWYLFYNAFFDKKSKKYTVINKWLRSTGREFRRKDFITAYFPIIEIKSKVEIEADEAEQRLYFFNAYNTAMADPTTPAVSKRFMKRKYMRLSKSTPSEIEIECPLEPEEVKAKEDLILLNRDILVEIEDMNEDHLTYLVIYRTWFQTKANALACRAREQAYMMSGQAATMRQNQQAMLWNAQSTANASNNQMTAMSMQSMWQDL